MTKGRSLWGAQRLLFKVKGPVPATCCGRLQSTASAAKLDVEDQQPQEPDYIKAKPFKDIPGPKGLPYLGTLFQYTKGPFNLDKFHEVLLSRFREYGPIFKETIAGETIVHLFHPDYIKTMYAQEGKVPVIPPLQESTQMYRKYRDMSPGLGNTNGEEWYRLRSAVQQMMMRPQAITTFLPHANDVIDDFIGRIEQVKDPASAVVPNFKNELLKWNLESSAMNCFETRLGCFQALPGSFQQNMLDANTKIFELSKELRFSVPWHKLVATKTWRTLVNSEDYFFGTGQKLVDTTLKTIEEAREKGELQEGQYAFLCYLLSRKELSYKDISIITLSLFSDGLNTTVPTMIGQLYCLATNPEKQQKLYEEVFDIAPDKEKPITPQVLNKATYLKACIKEGFRFFPIGTEVSRIPQKNITIGGYQIPAGMHVELNNNMLLKLPEYFDDPETYTPERWIRGGSGLNINPYLLLPFSYGPRTCAGKRFAEQEMNVMIMKLLQNYKIEWADSQQLQQRYVLLLTPDMDPKFRFVPRK